MSPAEFAAATVAAAAASVGKYATGKPADVDDVLSAAARTVVGLRSTRDWRGIASGAERGGGFEQEQMRRREEAQEGLDDERVSRQGFDVAGDGSGYGGMRLTGGGGGPQSAPQGGGGFIMPSAAKTRFDYWKKLGWGSDDMGPGSRAAEAV